MRSDERRETSDERGAVPSGAVVKGERSGTVYFLCIVGSWQGGAGLVEWTQRKRGVSFIRTLQEVCLPQG